jgi:hypothetical protein
MEDYMPEFTQRLALRNNELLKLAVADSVDAALLRFGQNISATEAQALKALSNEEIQTLARINEKIFTEATRLGGEAADWSCGVLC